MKARVLTMLVFACCAAPGNGFVVSGFSSGANVAINTLMAFGCNRTVRHVWLPCPLVTMHGTRCRNIASNSRQAHRRREGERERERERRREKEREGEKEGGRNGETLAAYRWRLAPALTHVLFFPWCLVLSGALLFNKGGKCHNSNTRGRSHLRRGHDGPWRVALRLQHLAELGRDGRWERVWHAPTAGELDGTPDSICAVHCGT